jgi:hypothetical protein
MTNRPHFLNGDEVFVKRALPRLIASIPERLIVTNRLILRDSHKHDKRFLLKYFQKYGHIKNFDIEHGFIDYDVSCPVFSFSYFIKNYNFLFLRIMMMLIVFYLLDHIIFMIKKSMSLNLLHLNNQIILYVKILIIE